MLVSTEAALLHEQKEIQRRLALGLLISAILHLIVFQMAKTLPDFSAKAPPPLPKHIKVEKISQQDLIKFRRVGVKNGAKEYMERLQKGDVLPKKFTRKIPKTKPKPMALKKSKKTTKVKTATKKKPLSLAALKADPVKAKTFEKRVETKPKEKDNQQLDLRVESNQEILQQRRNILKELAASPNAAAALENTGFNIKFEPPEGVSEDELNSMEKIYYSFQKRTFETYVTSFLKTYHSMLLRRPSIKRPLKENIHRLTGRVIFDKDGNIISIKIIRSSTDDDVHDLFEDTLKEMRALPNPPKDLVKKDGRFSIYYQLRING